MTFRIYLSPPDVGETEERYVLDALRSGWVAPLGPNVDAFEREVAEYVGVDHAVALSSGTAALHLGLLALGVGPGDEVIVPTMTFAATAFAVTYVGAVPVFVDSEPASYNLDPELLASLLADRAAAGNLPAAVIVADIYGQAADYDRLLPVCAEYGVPVLEDAAEALGAEHALGRAGSLGSVGVFSFNGNKIMTTSGGGMLVTNDANAAQRVRHWATQAREPVAWYQHEEIGFNYRMSNVLAALGQAQFSRLGSMIARRGQVKALYRDRLASWGVPILDDADWGTSNSWLTIALLGADHVEEARLALAAVDIEARPVWNPMHRQPVFRDAIAVLNGVSDQLFSNGLCLPSGSQLTDHDVGEVLDAIPRSGLRRPL